MCRSVCEQFGLKLQIGDTSSVQPLTAMQLHDIRVRESMRGDMTQMQESISSLQSQFASMQNQMNEQHMATQAQLQSLSDQLAALLSASSNKRAKPSPSPSQ
jgi:hypothetical protein